MLTLFSGATALASNDDWQTQSESAAITTAAAPVGAFSLTSGSKDSALVLTLAPVAYSFQVAGAGGTTGFALVEVYVLPATTQPAASTLPDDAAIKREG